MPLNTGVQPLPASPPRRDGIAHDVRPWRWMLGVCLVLVVHGSLYPWRFDPSVSGSAAWTAMWAEADLWTSLGDVAGNVVLFAPVGFLASRAWPAAPAVPGLRLLTIWAAAVAFALALQVAQFWVPARSAAVADVLWNGVGTALGLVLAAICGQQRRGQYAGDGSLGSPLMAMVLLWLAIEWWPFLPTIDWQHVKNALKPLLQMPPWNLRSMVEAALGIVVLAQVGRRERHRGLALSALVLAAAAGKLFLLGQVLSWPHVTGWGVGVAMAVGLVWRIGERAGHVVVVCLALGYFTFDELRPFSWLAQEAHFSWIPFVASLRGSLVVNTLALCWQLFWLGAVMVSACSLGFRAGGVAMALAGWALLLEVLQLWLPGRVADITPAVLPMLWWIAMPLWQGRESTDSMRGLARVEPRHAK